MKIIVCLDDRGGMCFNRRRQSRDRVMLDDMAKMTHGVTLYAEEFSRKLLEGHGIPFVACDDMEQSVGTEDYCFFECGCPNEAISDAKEIIAYRWNRLYPADVYFDIDALNDAFTLCESVELEGYSHEKITKEIYRR